MSRRALILQGHVLDCLRSLPDESVHCVVTSPPYWGPRDYKLEPQIWGGYPGCAHRFSEETVSTEVGRGNWAQATNGRGEVQGDLKTFREPIRATATRGFCSLCGAWRGCLGLEPTPELFVEHIVEVFREVRRALRSDGTLWLNMGDSYCSRPNGSIGASTLEGGHSPHAEYRRTNGLRKSAGIAPGLKHKDLVGMPWRVAFALQSDGWYLRSDCIWSKSNPMPESVADRPTKAHEYVFLLSKSARYFYDAEAVREPLSEAVQRKPYSNVFQEERPDVGMPCRSNGRRGAARKADTLQGTHGTTGHDGNGMRMLDKWSNPAGRNLRTVWSIATSPFPEAHFATFPPEIPEMAIKAGTSEKGRCPRCGSPWARQVQREFVAQDDVSEERGVRCAEGQKAMDSSNGWSGFPRGTTATTTTGWGPTCACLREAILGAGIQWPISLKAAVALAPQFDVFAPTPCAVLDPFGGSGTSAMVALRLQREAILCELNPDYVAMAERRIRGDAPLLNRVEIRPVSLQPLAEPLPLAAGQSPEKG